MTLKYATGYFTNLPAANRAQFAVPTGLHAAGLNNDTPGDCGNNTWSYNKVAAATNCTTFGATFSIK